MNDYDRAEYEADRAQEAEARAEPYVGEECEFCCEPMPQPRVFEAPNVFGTLYETAACSEDCEINLRYPPRHEGEDFRADWDGRYVEEVEYDDYGRRY